MAFIGERITTKEDKQYVASKGFTYIIGDPIISARSWAIDREKDMILVPTGGGGLEMPESYGLYLDGVIIDIEGNEKSEGERFDNDLKIHWFINKIRAPKTWFENGCGSDNLKQIITEAFIAYSYRRLKSSQVLEVTVEINAEPVQKYNSKGEEV